MFPHSEAGRRCASEGPPDRGDGHNGIASMALSGEVLSLVRARSVIGTFCIGGLHARFWENAEKRSGVGYCSAAVSRTQNMMWAGTWGTVHPRQLADSDSGGWKRL